ncbi:hypothetical protein PROFUN_00492 [Planoprotostelium fungivorum]|uniref:Uncharacterized protein n=1 Tax=Planoprotostelium fungivorum TaxID=1890364 RepID=A0A2P6N111_9EUKA|nr:hypothetical protein PROFUN_00492 [Planoprotostelium fungivorum]
MSTDVSRQEAKEDSQNYADKKTLKGLRVPKADLALIDALAKEKMKHLHTRYQVKFRNWSYNEVMGYLEVSPLAITIFEVQYGMFYLKKELVPFHVFAYENMTEMIWDSANSNVTIVYRWPKNSEMLRRKMGASLVGEERITWHLPKGITELRTTCDVVRQQIAARNKVMIRAVKAQTSREV